MNAALLAKAIRSKADLLAAPESLSKDEADTAELLIVLARVVEGKPLSRSFGAPGDWGYGTAIGDALAAHQDRADDRTCKNGLQQAANGIACQFPGRCFALFVFGAESGELAHYTSNGPREEVIKALTELREATGFSALPTRDGTEN